MPSGNNVLNLEPAGSNGSTRNRDKFATAKKTQKGSIGRAPDWLNDTAKNVWRLIVDYYKDLPILSAIDRTSLASLCVSAAKMDEIDRKIMACDDIDDERVLVRLRKDYEASFKQLSAEFGISPKSRSQLMQALKEAQVQTEKVDPLIAALSIDD